MTELSYLADSDAGYVREFRARVVSLPPGAVVLDRTYFYPTGGGQLYDQGSILRPGDAVHWPVDDVRKTGQVVLHRIGRSRAATLPSVGEEVEGRLDWERRHRHMRLHTAQHLVSALAFSGVGLKTRRAEMLGRTANIELEAPWPSSSRFDDWAQSVRDRLRTPAKVTVRHVPLAEWRQAPSARSGLVPLPAHVDPVRVIAIEGIDDCPCGGTHVRSTSEVGPVSLALEPARQAGPGRIRLRLDEPGPATPRE